MKATSPTQRLADAVTDLHRLQHGDAVVLKKAIAKLTELAKAPGVDLFYSLPSSRANLFDLARHLHDYGTETEVILALMRGGVVMDLNDGKLRKVVSYSNGNSVVATLSAIGWRHAEGHPLHTEQGENPLHLLFDDYAGWRDSVSGRHALAAMTGAYNILDILEGKNNEIPGDPLVSGAQTLEQAKGLLDMATEIQHDGRNAIQVLWGEYGAMGTLCDAERYPSLEPNETSIVSYSLAITCRLIRAGCDLRSPDYYGVSSIDAIDTALSALAGREPGTLAYEWEAFNNAVDQVRLETATPQANARTQKPGRL